MTSEAPASETFHTLPSQLTLFIFKTRYNLSHFNHFKKVFYYYLCVCVWACVVLCLNACGGSQRPEEGAGFHATVTGGVSCPTWVLGFKPQTSERAGSTLDH